MGSFAFDFNRQNMRIFKLIITTLFVLAFFPVAFAQEMIDYGGANPTLTADEYHDQFPKLLREITRQNIAYHQEDHKAPGPASALVLDSCRTLSTSWAPNNGNDGIMLNISTFDWVTIDNFSVYINSFDSGYVKIYYIADTAAGHEKSPVDWTFIDSAFVVGNGTSTPTFIPVNVNVTIPAWSMYSFYITGTGTPNILYFNGTGTAFDSTITVWPGAGLAYPFAMPTDTVYQNRVFSGIVHYCEAPVGVEELSSGNEVLIAPNPFSAHTEVIFDSPVAGAEVIIYNLLGAEVKRVSADLSKNVRISREGLGAGVYFVRVMSGSSILAAKKIVIE